MGTLDKELILEYLSLKQRELLYLSIGLSIDDDKQKALANSARGAYRELEKVKKAIREDSVSAHTNQLKENLKSKI